MEYGIKSGNTNILSPLISFFHIYPHSRKLRTPCLKARQLQPTITQLLFYILRHFCPASCKHTATHPWAACLLLNMKHLRGTESGWRGQTPAGFAHTGDGGEHFRYSEAERDVADLVFRNSRVQEDVKGEGADLGRRTPQWIIRTVPCSVSLIFFFLIISCYNHDSERAVTCLNFKQQLDTEQWIYVWTLTGPVLCSAALFHLSPLKQRRVYF